MRRLTLLFSILIAFSLQAKKKEPVGMDYASLPDKVYLHLDRQSYTCGDTMWIKAYAFHRNNHKLSNNCHSLHLQILDANGELVDKYKLLMVDGMAYGQILVGGAISTGYYQILAHTGHMKNFDPKFVSRTTIEVKDNPQELPKLLQLETLEVPVDLQFDFYPEGGTLIQNISNSVAFKALDSKGQTIEVEGILLKGDDEVAKLASSYDGMGSFLLTPGAEEYRVKITKPQVKQESFILPQAIEQGYTLSFEKQDDKYVYLKLRHNYGEEKEVNLWLAQHDQLLKTYNFKFAQEHTVTLSKKIIPKGLLTATLTDANQIPKAERMLFVAGERPPLSIMLRDSVVERGKRVVVKVKLQDAKAKGHFSASVVDGKSLSTSRVTASDIITYAFVQSEIKGRKNFNEYLSHNPSIEEKRDLFVQTRGWTAYQWLDKHQQLGSMKLDDFYLIDGECEINGMRYSAAKMRSQVIGNYLTAVHFRTLRNGAFRFKPQYQNREKQHLLIEPFKIGDFVTYSINNKDTVMCFNILDAYKDDLLDYRNSEVKAPVAVFQANGLIQGQDLKMGYCFGDYAKQASPKAVYNSRTRRISALTTEAVIGAPDDPGALIFVNGKLVGRDAGLLDFLTREDIKSIRVIGADKLSPSYGKAGDHGVVLVETRDRFFEDNGIELMRNSIILGGYVQPRKFVKQIYGTEPYVGALPTDDRVTLHWEPFLDTDERGEAQFSFYTAYEPGTKKIIIQGIDENGALYSQEYEFEVK